MPLSSRTPLIFGLVAATPGFASDLSDTFSIAGMVAPTGQCQSVSARLHADSEGQSISGTEPLSVANTLDHFGSTCRGGMPVALEIDFHPTEQDQLFVGLGWAAGNALNEVSPWRLAPWAANLQADVKDINGSSRDYLLQAWYRHEFRLGSDNQIAASLGLLDSTAYLDGNAYANDEYTQFMNEAFVNAGNYNLPSYDVGAALEARVGVFSLSAVGMNIHENDDGYNYNFWGVQVGWHPTFPIGAGNYRLLLAGTNRAFLSPASVAQIDAATDDDADLVSVEGVPTVEAGGQRESLLSGGLSVDQAISDALGIFLRFSWQDASAAVDYQALYSGGINLQGSAWKRPDDSIGLGYAYLEGGNTDVRNTNVFEVYYRAPLNDWLAVTADLQYMRDDLDRASPAQDNPAGWIFGLRWIAAF